MFLNKINRNWKEEALENNAIIYYIGNHQSIKDFALQIDISSIPLKDKLTTLLNSVKGNYAFVIQTSLWSLAVVDRISGYNIFYSNKSNALVLSNCPYFLAENVEASDVDHSSLIELKMSGYTTSNRTVLSDINRLRSGELLIVDHEKNIFNTHRYYEFYTNFVCKDNEDLAIDKLDSITNKIIERNICEANGRTIWIPLSGGLDSRFLISKFKQHGYGNLKSYSYGVKGNYDAYRAKYIAKKLDISWDFIPTSKQQSRDFFQSEERLKYWKFSDDLSVAPNVNGFFAVKELFRLNKMQVGDVVINGQSGDFISGQHIPHVSDMNGDLSKILHSSIINKHYSLRKSMMVDNNIKIIKSCINKTLERKIDIDDFQEFAKLYECWEWQERQSKRVINGQRTYDFFCLDWKLPMWDLEYLNFWRELPLSMKIDRRLFVKYLKKYDFYGLFNGIDPFMSRWPKHRIYIQFLGNIISKTCGKSCSDKFYKKLDWYSQYQYLYALTGREMYNNHWHDYKGSFPYLTDAWINENINQGPDSQCNLITNDKSSSVYN
jgi:asparagine synthase (glutamine-hydrolysing)